MPRIDRPSTNGHATLADRLRNGLRIGKEGPATSEEEEKGKDVLVTRRLSEYPRESVTWIWRKRFPANKLSVIHGDPGLGKTTVVLDIQSRVTTGRKFCDGAPSERAEVVFATSEDGIADTVRPRMEVLGADLDRVHIIDLVKDKKGKPKGFDLNNHLDVLDRWLGHHPNVRVVGIDPLASFLGDIDAHRNNEVRELLRAIGAVAERRHVGWLAVDHLSKGDGKAVHRGIGSIAFTAAPRAVWQVVGDPDEPGRSLLLPVKMNLARVDGLAYRMVPLPDDPDLVKLVWEKGDVTVTPDEVAAAGDSPRDEAKAWLRGLLKNGDVPSSEIEKKANKDGICMRTLKYAKKELGVKSKRKDDVWVWCQLSKGVTP